jgi:type II secretory pathway component HofQ
MRALVVGAMMWAAVAVASASVVNAGDLCTSGAAHHGATIDLDVKGADVRDVLRFVADLAHVNLVVCDDIAAKVTLALHAVPWDTAVCAIASVHHLAVTFDDRVLVVTRAR